MNGRRVPRLPLLVLPVLGTLVMLLIGCGHQGIVKPPAGVPLDGWVVYAAVDSQGPANSFILIEARLDGTQRTRLPGPDGLPSWCPRWSPDGRYVACLHSPGVICDPNSCYQILLQNAAGTRTRVLGWTSGDFIDWSPRGDRLLCLEGAVDTVGGAPTNYQPPTYQVFEGDSVSHLMPRQWAPDGERVYALGYAAPVPRNRGAYDPRYYEVFETEFPSGRVVRRLTHNLYAEWPFQVSPDGTRLLLQVDSAAGPELATLGIADSMPREFVPAVPGTSPRWAADGRTVVYLQSLASRAAVVRVHSPGDPRVDWQVSGTDAVAGWDYGPDIYLLPSPAAPGGRALR